MEKVYCVLLALKLVPIDHRYWCKCVGYSGCHHGWGDWPVSLHWLHILCHLWECSVLSGH